MTQTMRKDSFVTLVEVDGQSLTSKASIETVRMDDGTFRTIATAEGMGTEKEVKTGEEAEETHMAAVNEVYEAPSIVVGIFGGLVKARVTSHEVELPIQNIAYTVDPTTRLVKPGTYRDLDAEEDGAIGPVVMQRDRLKMTIRSGKESAERLYGIETTYDGKEFVSTLTINDEKANEFRTTNPEESSRFHTNKVKGLPVIAKFVTAMGRGRTTATVEVVEEYHPTGDDLRDKIANLVFDGLPPVVSGIIVEE